MKNVLRKPDSSVKTLEVNQSYEIVKGLTPPPTYWTTEKAVNISRNKHICFANFCTSVLKELDITS